MEAAELQILWVEPEPGVTPSLDAGLRASPFGRVVLTRCASLAEASSMLGERGFDGMLISLGANGFAQLPAWTGLAQAVPDMAVVVLVSGSLDAAVAARLVQAGVQDVLGGAQFASAEAALADAARSLRLSIDRKRIERDARRASATDLRTGLPDRQQLIDHVSQLLALRGREPAPMALLALRVEGFETVEASLGSESANVLRRKVAVRLRGAVRASDVVAALTADSFALLLASTEEPIDAELVAHKLLHALHQTFTIAGQQVAVATSIGISRYPSDGSDAGVLLRQAVAAAAAADTRGRDGFVNWRESQWRDTGAANDGEVDAP
ncbi:MAG TPA: GGDEF domain-containing protein [Burkholderiaceae bacterium]|nr:GGDEF domain-containing protein [Burkholderiaceae bacterium]